MTPERKKLKKEKSLQSTHNGRSEYAEDREKFTKEVMDERKQEVEEKGEVYNAWMEGRGCKKKAVDDKN